MKLTEMPKDKLNLLSYIEIAYRYLKENKVTMKTPDLFREVCNLLGFNDNQYIEKIGDFYTSLTLDKRFIVLDNTEWDLRENHAVEIVYDDDEVDVVEEDEEVEEEEETSEDSPDAATVDPELDDDDDDLDDLTIITDDEAEE